MAGVVDRKVLRGGVAVALTGVVLAFSSAGSASASPPVSVACNPAQPTTTSVSVDRGTQVTLTLLGVPLVAQVFNDSGPLSTTVGGLLAPVLCKVVVTVVQPVASAVPPAVTAPVASAVAPVASAVQAAPPVAAPGVPVRIGGPAPGTTPPSTSPSTSDSPGGGTPPVGSAPGGGSGSTPAGPGTGVPTQGGGLTGSVQGAGSPGLLPGASGATGPTAGTVPGTSGFGSFGAPGFPGLAPSADGRPSLFGSPLLAGYTTSGSAAQLASLASIPVAQAASQSSVQALDAQLGSRPGLVIFAAVLALAATAGCTVRQWVLRAVPSLAVCTPAVAAVAVGPVTKARHRR